MLMEYPDAKHEAPKISHDAFVKVAEAFAAPVPVPV
jgi:hypothetical protein